MFFLFKDICSKCKKEIEWGDLFILEGKYPSKFSKWLKPTFLNGVEFNWYGNVYHKECYIAQVLEVT
jgi:hypothetical protein